MVSVACRLPARTRCQTNRVHAAEAVLGRVQAFGAHDDILILISGGGFSLLYAPPTAGPWRRGAGVWTT